MLIYETNYLKIPGIGIISKIKFVSYIVESDVLLQLYVCVCGSITFVVWLRLYMQVILLYSYQIGNIQYNI